MDKKDLPPILDLKRLNENQRCELVANTCAANLGKLVGLIVDNEEKIIVRYIRKIKEFNPLVNVERAGTFTEGGFILRASQPSQGNN